MPTDLPSGVSELRLLCFLEKERKNGQREGCDGKSGCTLVKCCHTLAGALQIRIKNSMYTLVYAHTHSISTSCRLTHLPSQEAMGPVGQSKLESLVHLFTSNYRNRAISATTTPAFFFFHILEWEREGGREGERQLGSRNKRKVWERDEERERRKREKNKALTAFSHNGEWLSHPLSTATVCSVSVQYNRTGRGRVSCIVSPLILM